MNKIRIGPSDGKERVSNESSVIVLHQFPRTSRAPNVSPFPIKVETFLRMITEKIGNPSSESGRRAMFDLVDPKGKEVLTFPDLKEIS